MKKIFQYLILATLIISFHSCNDLFNPTNENLIGADKVFVNPANTEGVLMNVYGDLISSYIFDDVATDDAVSNQTSNSYRKMATGELTAQFNPLNRWDKYESVLYVNKFLSVVDELKWMDIPELNVLYKRRMHGEALALRALMHYYILEANAGKDASGNLLGIPYVKGFIQPNENFNLPRLTFKATVDSIMSDFNAAYDSLPYIYSDSRTDLRASDTLIYQAKYFLSANSKKYDQRINGKIVRALQARVKLFAASKAFLNSQESYKEAANYATSVLAQSNYVLPTDGVEFYNTDADATNPEFIWRFSVLTGNSTQEANNFPPSLNGKGNVNPTQNLVDAFPMKDGYPIGESTTYAYDPQNPYVNRDPRLAKFIIYNGSTLGGGTINTTTLDPKNGINSVPLQSTRTGYYLKKLLRPDVIIPVSGSPTGQKHYSALFRATELFLILAESENEIGGPDYKEGASTFSARDILRAIRKRALSIATDTYLDGINNPEDMRKLIQRERRLELCFEGFRFWDLRRWALKLDDTATGYYNNGSGYTKIDVEPRSFTGDKYLYMPLPYTELQKYTNLIQNAGW